MTPLLVRDLMSFPVHTLGPEANGAEVSDIMRQHRIRHVPITDGEGRLVGLVTHRDLLAKAFGGGQDLPPSIRRPYLRSVPVSDVMVTEVCTVDPDADLCDAACGMVDRQHGCLPVVEDGQVTGILTATDFVRYVAGCD